MRRSVIGVLLTFVFAAATTVASGYEVTKVIEIGPAVPLLTGGALKWSPDGTMLAYFANNYLMVSDTLGNSRQVVGTEGLTPMRAEWASNNEFAVNLANREDTDSMLYRLVVYDIVSGSQRLVRECWRTRWSLLPGHSGFDGPYVTMEGNAYYEEVVISGLEEGELKEKLKSTVVNKTKTPLSSAKGISEVLASNHLQVWGKDGLYSVNWAGADSTQLSSEDASGALKVGITASPDRTWIFRRGRLMNRITHDTIDVRQFTGSVPAGTDLCGYSRISFNPRSEEILFQHYCESGDTLVIDRIATFDYSSKVFALLDTLTGIEGGTSPVYAPDGRMISFCARGKAYIIWRGVTP